MRDRDNEAPIGRRNRISLPGGKSLLAVLSLVNFLALAGCISINDQTVADMPTRQLCEILGPTWITLPSEVAAVHRELKKRGKRCSGGRVAYERPKPKSEDDTAPSSGSGIVINRNGYVLTNFHVAGRCRTLKVIYKETRVPAKTVAGDETNDLAVLRIEAETEDFGTFRRFPKIALGEPVMVFGYPLRGLLADQLNATSGDVTSLAGIQGDSRFLQISAPIQPGNSGGPIVDMSGLVIGIATLKLNAVGVARIIGDIPQNVNFGLRASTALNLLDGHGIGYSSGTRSRNLPKPEIAAKLAPAVVVILCNHD